MKKLEAVNIQKSFGNIHVLDSISLSLDVGQFVSILGPSGCGKSTLFNIMAGLLQPDEGSVLVDGMVCTGKTGRIGFMQQKDLLLPWKSVLENTAIPLILRGIPKKNASILARDYFTAFGLEGFEEAYPHQLSGGMRQRAALLRTYLFKSDIMLLDEPFGALDAITRRQMQQWLLGIVKQFNLTVLLVTHDVEEAILLSKRVVLLTPRPATVQQEICIDLPDERDEGTMAHKDFIAYKMQMIASLS